MWRDILQLQRWEGSGREEVGMMKEWVEEAQWQERVRVRVAIV